jgi:endonuclease/exonuclease/phosphatase family metal-dependent hydrolase
MRVRGRSWERVLVGGAALSVAAAGCAHALRARVEGPPAGCPDVGSSVRWISSGSGTAPAGWCRAVGPPALLAAAAPAPTSADSVLVLTWNTHVGGGDLRRLVRDLRAGRLTGGDPPAHFVLLLQEVYREGPEVPAPTAVQRAPRGVAARTPLGARTDVVADARALGLHLLYVPSMRNGLDPDGPPEDKGNAILSTLPLDGAAALELPFEAQRRVVALAAVGGATADGRPWRLQLASVHLDLRSRAARIWASTGTGRLRQARALPAALNAGGAAVLGGDLNTWAGGLAEPAPAYLRARFPGGRTSAPRPTFAGPLGLGRELDHLFVRGALAAPARRVDDRYGSDHYPVWTWVRPVASEDRGQQPGTPLEKLLEG